MTMITAYSDKYHEQFHLVRPPAASGPGPMGRDLRNVEAGVPDVRAIVHLVDPDEVATVRMAQLCRSAGIDARSHAGVDAFIAAMSRNAPGCVILHMGPSTAGSLEFVASPARRGPATGLPMIVTADRADIRTAVLAMKAGVIDFLEKPLRDDDVLQAVLAALRADRERRQVEARRCELADRYATLTQRERQVMALVTEGQLNKQVAGRLGLSEVTVKAHRGSMMRKMNARTLAGLVRMADVVSGCVAVAEGHG